jgi:hypothetical protein
MDINSVPKKYLLGAIGVLVVILLLVTLLQPGSFRYQGGSPTADDLARSAQIQKEYADYLASIKPDPEASKQLFSQVISQDEVQKDVASKLQVNQKVTIPQVPDSQLTLSKESGQAPTQQFFEALKPIVSQFTTLTEPASPSLFTDADADQVAIETSAALERIYKTPVPQDAVAYQKAQINTLQQYQSLAQTAKIAQSNPDSAPWPKVYSQYVVMNDQVGVMKSEFQRLDKQYGLTGTRGVYAQQSSHNPLIKSADAQFSVIVTDDIWANIEKGIREGIAAAFAKFMNTYLDKLITDIQNNYYVANFLYYTDALVRGQYVNDYLNKYIADPIDRGIITRFIPQFSCANNKQDLGPIFVAKARQYLGFDPATIDPNSSDFYTKIARLPDLSPEQQELEYRDAAQAAMVQANQAAIIEQLTPTGTKLPRSDVLGKQITTTVASINASLQASFNAKLGLGTQNSQSVVSQIVSSTIQQFTDKYLFKGVVLKEQNTCIQVPQLQPIIPSGTPTTF